MYRKTYVEINLNNIENNVKNIISKYNNYKYYIAMVKSNAYNHGMYTINQMIESGINYLAVSSLEEALEIRKYNKDIGILCTEVIHLEDVSVACKNNVTFTIHDIEYLKKLIKSVKDRIKVHIKIDTGMNRLGISDRNVFNEAVSLIKNSNLYLEGLYTHFATPGIIDKMFDNQVQKFKDITSDIDLSKIDMVHLSSSFIVLSHPKIEFANGIRIGTILYGYDISLKEYSNSIRDRLIKIRNNYYKRRYKISDVIRGNDIKLKPAFSLKTSIIQIKNINTNDVVGYGCLYKANKPCRIATLEIGYDDGIGFEHKNRYVVINNKKYPVIGEVSMCMMSILIDESVNIDDEVYIVGNGITLGSIASLNNSSFHNMLVNIGKKLPKVYIKDNKKVYEED